MVNRIQFPIIFFEESPHLEKNQEKAKLLDFPSVVFLATEGIGKFYELRDKYLKVNPKLEIGWWPVFKTIWLSPFTPQEEIEKLIFSLKERTSKNEKLKILLDLEMPLLKPQYFFLGLKDFRKSKQLIKDIIIKSESLNIEIYTFEYHPHFLIFPFLLEKLGLTYLSLEKDYKRIISAYTSFVPIGLRQLVKKSAIYGYQKSKRETFLALGLFAKGKSPIERTISVKGIERDIEYFLNRNINKFAFYRLGGLNEDYLKIIKKFT